jgi:GGDEF domain-containing protein
MQTIEITIWAAMAGGLLMVMAPVALDWARRGRYGAWRELLLLFIFGSGAVLLTGVPEQLLGLDDPHRLLPLKVGLGPLAGGLRLGYLSGWLGGMFKSNLFRRFISGGALLLGLAGVALAVWASLDPHSAVHTMLGLSAVLSLAAVLMGLLVIVILAVARGAALRDPLARAMLAAGVSGLGMIVGLYAKALEVNDLGNGVWAITAACTLTYLFIVTSIAMERAKTLRRLQRSARSTTVTDALTGLPTGAELLVQVDHALWRSARASRDTVVIAVWVNNLYELSNVSVQHVDQEIQTRLTERLRRVAGFRNVLGLYHPRCFIVVPSTVLDEKKLRTLVQRLRAQLFRPTLVGSLSKEDHVFMPQVGIGIVRVPASSAEPTVAMDDAEALAQSARTMDGGVAIRVLGRKHVTPLARYDFLADDRDVLPISPTGLSARA